MYELKMADGSTVPVSMAGVGIQGGLWIHAEDKTMAECFRIFSDQEKTASMRIDYDETIYDEFKGYIVLVSLSVCDGFVRIGLERGSHD